jgi:hypothetical protein
MAGLIRDGIAARVVLLFECETTDFGAGPSDKLNELGDVLPLGRDDFADALLRGAVDGFCNACIILAFVVTAVVLAVLEVRTFGRFFFTK